MKLILLAAKNLLGRPMASLVSLLLLTLGVALISLVLIASQQFENRFVREQEGVGMIVGAKGSPLQLVLSALYQVDNPTGNIELAEAERLLASPYVEKKLPLSFGDSYQGLRIVGTTADYADFFGLELAEGRTWAKPMEVVLGAETARKTGLKIGDEFLSEHTQVEAGADSAAQALQIHEGHPLRVVGIYKTAGRVADRLLLTGQETIWHVHADHGPDPSGQVTAVLVRFRSPLGALMLPNQINQNSRLMAANPSNEINRLLDLMSSGEAALNGFALLILVLAGLSLLFSLLHSLRERRYELALMRVLGASRKQVFLSVLYEATLLSLAGFLMGWGISRLVLWAGNSWMPAEWGGFSGAPLFLPEELILLGIMLGLGWLGGSLPAIQAAKTDIHETLSHH